jgi:hypothetical protein
MSRHSIGRSISSSLPLSQSQFTTTTSSSLPLTQSYSRCEELRVRIYENHLSYLNRDETPAKLEMRTKIECLIAEYLSLVPHSHKFSFIEISNCFNRSITENREFSAYKAIGAFEALEKYATNLITHPWRKEYQSICPYSGFYRHVIDRHVVGAKHILFLMGFVHNSAKGIYQLTDAPIDPDKVSRVSLECLVAFVELQIMVQIRETLKLKGYSNISWREIHAIRVEYICGQTDAIKLICEMKRTAKLIDYENSSTSNTPKRLVSNTDHSLMSNGFSLIDDNMSPQRQSYRDKHLTHNYLHNPYIDEEETAESFDLLNYPIVNPHSYALSPSCHYCLPHSSSLPACPPPHLTHVSPALFASFPTNTSQTPISPKIHSVSKAIQAELPNMSNGIEDSFTKINILSNSSNKKSITEVDGLSSNSKTPQTRKDLLQSSNNSSDKSTKRSSFYDNLDPLISLESVSSELKTNSTDKKQLDKKSPTQERSKSSLERKKIIDGNPITKIVNSIKTHSNNAKSSNDSNNSSNNCNIYQAKQSNLGNAPLQTSLHSSSVSSLGLNSNNGKTRTDETQSDNQKQIISYKEIKVGKGWSCSTCTYLNSDSKDVCEMCHRSRKIGNEAMPLISGGRECSRCTLVNDKEEKFCRACDTSLADSPTYI